MEEIPYVITMDTSLDVTDKYKELVAASLDGDSFYIRVKDTVAQMVEDNELTQQQGSEVLSNVMAQIGTSLTGTAMSNALEWVKTEKTLYLAKIKAEIEMQILKNQAEATRIEAITAKYNAIKIQADIRRQDGTYTLGLDGITVTALGNDGLLYQETLNKQEENKMLIAKTSDIWASTNKTVSEVYQTFGMHSGYTVTSTGLAGVQDNTPIGLTTLTDLQKSIAKEQAKGYAYNAWSSAATSSANMIGVLLTSETADVAAFATPKAAWESSIVNLKNASLPVFTGIDVASPSCVITISKTVISLNETATVTFTFTEQIENLLLSNISADHGVLSLLVVSPTNNKVWTATLTPQAGTESATNKIIVYDLYRSFLTKTPGTIAVSPNYAINTI